MAPVFPPARATAMAARGQVRALLAVTATVLLVALTIDFADHMGDVLDAAAEAGGPWPILQYVVYRSADILLRQMPIIAIIAGFMAETARIKRGETVILGAAGETLRPAIWATLILALALGVIQTSLEAKLRPAAVWAQVELGLGSYAARFGPRQVGPVWLTVPDGALRANLEIGTDLRLRSVLFLPGPTAQPDADTVILVEAADMRPAPTAGDWVARDVVTFQGRAPTTRNTTQTEILALGLDPLRVTYHNVPAFYLTGDVLAQLRSYGPDPDLDTGQARRVWSWALPGAFLLLGVALAAQVIPVRGVRVLPLLAGLFTAYLGTVVLRVFWALGEIGTLPAQIAVALPLALIWAGAIGLIVTGRWRGPAG